MILKFDWKNMQKIMVFLLVLFSRVILGHDFLLDPNIQIMQISIPKAGTNLLSKCLGFLAQKTPTSSTSIVTDAPRIFYQINAEEFEQFTFLPLTQFWTNHLLYTPELAQLCDRKNLLKFFMYRDPRDLCVSLAYFMKISQSYWPQAYQMSFDDLLLDIITQ